MHNFDGECNASPYDPPALTSEQWDALVARDRLAALAPLLCRALGEAVGQLWQDWPEGELRDSLRRSCPDATVVRVERVLLQARGG